VLRVIPRRAADQDREHELIVAREKIPDLIAALRRVLDYETPTRPASAALCWSPACTFSTRSPEHALLLLQRRGEFLGLEPHPG
jgi:hypothetical protein